MIGIVCSERCKKRFHRKCHWKGWFFRCGKPSPRITEWANQTLEASFDASFCPPKNQTHLRLPSRAVFCAQCLVPGRGSANQTACSSAHPPTGFQLLTSGGRFARELVPEDERAGVCRRVGLRAADTGRVRVPERQRADVLVVSRRLLRQRDGLRLSVHRRPHPQRVSTTSTATAGAAAPPAGAAASSRSGGPAPTSVASAARRRRIVASASRPTGGTSCAAGATRGSTAFLRAGGSPAAQVVPSRLTRSVQHRLSRQRLLRRVRQVLRVRTGPSLCRRRVQRCAIASAHPQTRRTAIARPHATAAVCSATTRWSSSTGRA